MLLLRLAAAFQRSDCGSSRTMHHANLGCESESTTTGALVTEPACLALVVQLVDRVDGEGISIVANPVAGAAGPAS